MMEFMLLDQLTLQQQRGKIKTRVARVWESTIPHFKNQVLSLECLLIDEKGNSMQATIRKHDIQQFEPKISEGIVYFIENFNIIPSRDKYKVVDRKYMIQINKWTNIAETTDNVETIPYYCFEFSDFDCIKGKRNNDTCLIDVLGSITAIGPISYTYVGTKQTPIRNLEIQNSEDDTFPVTLWDKFAIEFNDSIIYEKESIGPVIIIFASMSVRTYKEKLYLSTCSASRVYINLEIPEVSAFRNTLQRGQIVVRPIQPIEVAKQPNVSPYEQMFTNRKTISDLIALNPTDVENIKYTCEAKLEEIDTTYGWWYKACYDCKGGVKDYDGTFWCNQCGKNDQSPVPWYKLNTIVTDDTGSANFTIFGKSAQDLIRVSAQQLATATNSNRFVLPPIVKNVIGQTFIFQVSLETRRFNTSMQSFRVTRIFQSPLSGKVKIEEKDEDDVHISGDGTPTNPKGTKNDILDKISTCQILQQTSNNKLEETAKQSRGKKRMLSLIQSSDSDEEEK